MKRMSERVINGHKNLNVGDWKNGKWLIFLMNLLFLQIIKADIISENMTMSNGMILNFLNRKKSLTFLSWFGG